MAGAPKKGASPPRNPERSRERILSAALKEFSTKGFAGARVDAIARRANINKRMLYHYFGDKEGLFKAVLSRKLSERQSWAETLSGEPDETLPFWFEMACKDADWVRLFQWEALQGNWQNVINETERLESVARGLKRIQQRQERGQISAELDPRHVMLTMRSLTMFPVAFPQLTRLITGKSIFDPKFQKERTEFLKKFAAAFRPGK
ncbi:MAG TPA: TetR/AcrR family transcriptional regulator [Pseudomonadales bacterium]|nr:TetR/AcrR family transcriptional regulator [Pseudomonadales bacterium]